MPIYAYRCNECGFSQDILQKIADPTLTVCPSCGKPAFTKQVTAAGFQLKGSGWYATDFKGSGGVPTADKPGDKSTESTPTDPATGSTDTAKTKSTGSEVAGKTTPESPTK